MLEYVTMSAEARTVEVWPPFEPLQFPLYANQICIIVDVNKSTLLRWEREGKIPHVKRIREKSDLRRYYDTDDLINLLLVMKNMTVRISREGVQPKFPWLQGFDPAVPCELITPTGFHIKFE